MSTEVHERKVRLGDGEDYTLYFRELPHTEFRKLFDAERSEDENVRAASTAKMIVASLANADGKPALTLREAMQLKPAVATAIASAILEVNGMGAKSGNPPPPEANDGSGTSSLSPSADAASGNGRL